MMKVCILANSHVAMLKKAHDRQPPEGWEPVFFAAPATRMKALKAIRNGRILATTDSVVQDYIHRTSGGRDEVVMADYDAFVVLGLTAKTQTAMRLFCSFQPAAHRVSADARLISEGAFRETVRDKFAATNAARFLRMTKKAGKPVLFLPSPLPSEVLLHNPAYAWVTEPGGAAAVAWINETCRALWQDMADAAGATLILQPAFTIGANHLTRAIYSDGAEQMSGQSYAVENADHMNEAFGQLMFGEIGKALGGDVGLSSAA